MILYCLSHLTAVQTQSKVPMYILGRWKNRQNKTERNQWVNNQVWRKEMGATVKKLSWRRGTGVWGGWVRG